MQVGVFGYTSACPAPFLAAEWVAASPEKVPKRLSATMATMTATTTTTAPPAISSRFLVRVRRAAVRCAAIRVRLP